MQKALITNSYLNDIADAIRVKKSSTSTYTPGQMASEIESIPTGGITPTGTISVTENGTYNVTNYASASVNVSGYPEPTGTITITENGNNINVKDYASANVNVSIKETSYKDVNFIDYDGTILYSYTKSEFLSLTSLPDNPTHDGLIAQGWNWTLANAKTHVNTMGRLNIGQMYTTDDGRTRIYINLLENTLDIYLSLAVDGTVKVY